MNTSKKKMVQLISLIENINTLHKLHSEKWFETLEKTYNLKNLQVRDIYVNNDDDNNNDLEFELDFQFIIYMNKYCDLLNEVYFNPLYDFLDPDDNFKLTSRIKHPDSRISKILHYRLNKNEKGKVSLNKCLNDLMGFRIFTDDFEHNDAMVNKLKQMLAKCHVKVHNSCKGNYKATHVYFYNGNNIYFPWELQIWNTEDVSNNLNSHAIHKQAYTKWPSIYENYLGKEKKNDV